MLKSSYVLVGPLVLLLASVAFGQSTNAAITGQVTDSHQGRRARDHGHGDQ